MPIARKNQWVQEQEIRYYLSSKQARQVERLVEKITSLNGQVPGQLPAPSASERGHRRALVDNYDAGSEAQIAVDLTTQSEIPVDVFADLF
jgi:hypothetical protein